MCIINKLLGINETYKAPDRIWDILGKKVYQ